MKIQKMLNHDALIIVTEYIEMKYAHQYSVRQDGMFAHPNTFLNWF